MSPLSFAVALLLCISAVSATDILSIRTRPGLCSVVMLEPGAEATLDAVQPASARVSMTTVSTDEDMANLDERCRSALIALDGSHLQTYVALLNDGQIPAYAVLKVTQHHAASQPPVDRPSAGLADRTLRKSGKAARRWIESSTHAAGAMLGLYNADAWKGEGRGEAAVLQAPSAHRHRRQLAQTPTPTPTPTPASIEQQVQNAVSNSLSPTEKKWIKIAIIIGIVLAALAALSLACCLVRCICWPCCCAARLVK